MEKPINLKDQLIRDEGKKQHPKTGRHFTYADSEGYLTIGFGRLVDERLGGGLTHGESLFLLDNDIERVVFELTEEFPWVLSMDDVIRREVLINMAFNMGITRLKGFTKFLAAMKAGDWATAKKEMIDSKWHRQVGERAVRLEEQIITGERQ